MKYKAVIGLEVHVELMTKSKMFCSCSSEYFGKKPNTHTCPVCLGLPGALPVPNEKAIKYCRLIGLSLNCMLNKFSKFDRKNYFYPDLPKGYQISQYDIPFCENGYIKIGKNNKKIRIKRVHMEEDTGKLIHVGDQTLVDFNRSGVPLVEIVTEPDFESSDEVVLYLKELQQIIRFLNVSNANMEKGEMRLEPNISLKKENSIELPKYKVEVKNINSFAFVKKAIDFELKRQEKELMLGITPRQETRGFNESKQKTFSQRSKEEAHDYRYFPEPDIPPLLISEKEINFLKESLLEMPKNMLNRFINEYTLSYYDAEILTRDSLTAKYFEEAVILGKKNNIVPKQIANFIINKKINPKTTSITKLINDVTSSSKIDDYDEEKLKKIIDNVIKENQKAIIDYKNGKEQVLMFLVGQVLKKLNKKINIEILKNELERRIKND